MELKVYAIKDRQLDGFMHPFYMHTHGQATRAFRDQINDPESSASKHPEDYDLYYLGNFDDQTGQFTSQDNAGKPKQIAIGANLFERNTDPNNQARN